jgi:hypothetical protein
MTTNIRNIMRNQDKGLLTASTRLLNSSVKNQGMKSEIKKQIEGGYKAGDGSDPNSRSPSPMRTL